MNEPFVPWLFYKQLLVSKPVAASANLQHQFVLFTKSDLSARSRHVLSTLTSDLETAADL